VLFSRFLQNYIIQYAFHMDSLLILQQIIQSNS